MAAAGAEQAGGEVSSPRSPRSPKVSRFEELRQIFSEHGREDDQTAAKGAAAAAAGGGTGFSGIAIALAVLVDGLQKMGLMYVGWREAGGLSRRLPTPCRRPRLAWFSTHGLDYTTAVAASSHHTTHHSHPIPTRLHPSFAPVEQAAFYRDLGGKDSNVTLDQFVSDVKRARRYRLLEREEDQRAPWDELMAFALARKGLNPSSSSRHAVTSAAQHLYKEMDHHNVGLTADQLFSAMSRAGFRLTDAETRALHRDCDPNSEGLVGIKYFAAAFSLAKTKEADAMKTLQKEQRFLKTELPRLKKQREKEEIERQRRERREREREESKAKGGASWWGARGARTSKDSVLAEAETRKERGFAFGLTMDRAGT